MIRGASRSARGWLAGLAVLVTAAALAGAAAPARADRFEVIAGWEGDSHAQGYGFGTVGALIPLTPHLVLPVRASGSFLYYDYDSSATTLRVRSPGVSLLAGLRVTGPGGSATLMGGGEVRWDHRETEDVAGPVRRETNGGFIVQAEGDLSLAKRWRALALANYAGAARYTYGRAAVRYQATNLDWQRPTTSFAGIEGVLQGNDESRAFQGGGFVECTLVHSHLSLALHGGYKESWSPGEDHRRGAYFGAGIYRAF
jgi:hypothetical protein